MNSDSLVFRLCENAPELLREVCEELGWREFESDDDEEENWNLWWKTSGFRTSDFEYCRPWQRINHFPKSCLITRKDSLARNLRKMRGIYGGALYNFAPMAFNLPNDYKKFVTEYSNQKDGKRNLWICKPADQSRGRGIFLFRDLKDLTYNCATVVQKYISNPLLISGYKFDLRLYVLVTSFHPFNVYIYHEGLVRFSTEKFDLASTDNVFSHLTNTSINKFSPSYSAEKERVGIGCKWSLNQLRIYFHQHSIDDRLLWHRITSIIILTLLMQAPEVPNNRPNCFELFGFDVLIDENMKPWLLEVNFSPALGNDCPLDVTVKKPMLHDIMQALRFTEADALRDATKKQKCGTRKSRSKALRKNFSIKQRASVSKPLRVNTCSLSTLKDQDSDCDSKPPEGYAPESDACVDCNGNAISITVQNVNYDTPRDEGANCDAAKEVEDTMHCSTRAEFNSSQGRINGLASTAMAELMNNDSRLQLSKTKASFEFLAAFERDLPSKPVENSSCDPFESPQTGLPLGYGCSLRCRALEASEDALCPEDLTKDEVLPSVTNKNWSAVNTNGRITRSGNPRRVSSLRIQRIHSLIAPRTAGVFIQRRLSTTVATLRCSSSGNLGSLTRRTFSDRLYPQFPSKRQNASNCKYVKPATRFGNYILAFPFNESTYRASQGGINAKVIVEEIKVALKTVNQDTHQTPKVGEKRRDSLEHLDLEKPFWGFRPMYGLK